MAGQTLRNINLGILEMPDCDLPTFLISGGGSKPKVLPIDPTLTQLFEQYFESLPVGSLERETINSMKTHQRHLERLLGKKLRTSEMTTEVLQKYVNARALEDVTSDTIKKPIVTLRAVWNRILKKPFPKGITYPKSKERPPYQSLKEVQRGGDWDSLYLTSDEVDELLGYVRATARHPFVFPLICFAAHTGARRAEILRCLKSDVNLEQRIVTLRERKKSHSTRTTRRVPLSPLLADALGKWLDAHPGTNHLFAISEMERSKKSGVRPMTRDEAHDHLKRALKGSKWEVIKGFHTFRHSFISALASKGVDQRIIDEFVGHQTEEQRRRYRHLYPDVTRNALMLAFGTQVGHLKGKVRLRSGK
ncbi:MAG: tyrosine-type recombinase/integrase [Planctomycetia bacterium]|nr:tyrosine-type recombinase/integrase [Planctomycetia bacterium]